jgi:hypothetical protein
LKLPLADGFTSLVVTAFTACLSGRLLKNLYGFGGSLPTFRRSKSRCQRLDRWGGWRRFGTMYDGWQPCSPQNEGLDGRTFSSRAAPVKDAA